MSSALPAAARNGALADRENSPAARREAPAKSRGAGRAGQHALCGLLLWLGLCGAAAAQPPSAAAEASRLETPQAGMPATASPARPAETESLILEVELDGSLLSDSLLAYQDGARILLPMGELARLLSLAIAVDAAQGRAQGFIVQERNGFALNLASGLVEIAGRRSSFDSARVAVIGDDLYAPAGLLEAWWQVGFEVDLRALRLQVRPQIQLPLQARLERERQAQRLRSIGAEDDLPAYPLRREPHRLARVPMADLTFGADARFGVDAAQYRTAFTGLFTGDLLGMEGSLYVREGRGSAGSDYRLVLGRTDPDGGLLGPLQARRFAAGNIQLPGIANLMRGSGSGVGIAFGNRPLSLPTTFDRQSLRGELPAGWDVTLYYNEALVGFQQSRPDGLYAFDDLPLSYGPNEFRLVFNGPQGQLRTETRRFSLDRSVLQPGEVLYDVAHHRDDRGDLRSMVRFDLGLGRQLSAGAAVLRLPRPAATRPDDTALDLAQVGLRAYLPAAIVTTELVHSSSGGRLAEGGVKTRLGRYAVDYLHTRVDPGFESELLGRLADPLRQRDRLRLQGVLAPDGLPRMPVALDVQRNRQTSGLTVEQVTGRISMNWRGTALTQGLGWLRSHGADSPASTSLRGNLQLSRRIAGIGVSGQMGYSLRPSASLDTLALAADRLLGDGYRINGGLLHDVASGSTLVSAGLSRSIGRFGFAISSSYSDRKEFALALQLFVALSQEPRSGRWSTDALPIAATGALAARAFVDRNMNGVHDPGEAFVPNAGFVVNRGGRLPVRTDDEGTATITRLLPGRYTDIGLDPGTLEDPQWRPLDEGYRVLPRPGLTQSLDFPVIYTSDVDGTVRLADGAGQRGVGNVEIELVDRQGRVAYTTRSASDGFYLFSGVVAGRYTVRVSPAQLERLRLQAERSIEVLAPGDGDFIQGQDLTLRRRP